MWYPARLALGPFQQRFPGLALQVITISLRHWFHTSSPTLSSPLSLPTFLPPSHPHIPQSKPAIPYFHCDSTIFPYFLQSSMTIATNSPFCLQFCGILGYKHLLLVTTCVSYHFCLACANRTSTNKLPAAPLSKAFLLEKFFQYSKFLPASHWDLYLFLGILPLSWWLVYSRRWEEGEGATDLLF